MSINHFGEGTETLTRDMEGRTVQVKWNWSKFQTTEGYPLNDNMINWVIGQEQALNESFLCLDEWVHKLKHLERTQWYARWSTPEEQKPAAKTMISPGPYLLLLGDPGTGKSLLGRALSEKLTQVYKKMNIKIKLCEMVREKVSTKHKKFSFPTPTEIDKVELEIPSEQLPALTDFFYKANGKLMVSRHQIGVSVTEK